MKKRLYLVICLFTCCCYYIICPPPLINSKKVINIGFAIDINSAKDLLISINSIVTTAYDNDNLHFYILACDNSIADAKILQISLNNSIRQCYSTLKYDILPFSLPKESGFYLQMINSKRKSHWTSPSGADMARFFMPKLFHNIDRILYLDNDVLVTCCLEEIFNTFIDHDKVIGIALDDLKWATVTQFQRQYNNSHPLVIKNIRRFYYNLSNEPINEKEFWKSLPRYPNDGVLLIDIKKYNNMKILDCMNEIALANGHGDYVVGLGTQQFTVLCMHDRWIELSPRANLRHFPDMARGYLMWFLYNGFIHYAGQSKPRHICQVNGQNIDNEHRMQTYTPWVSAVYNLNKVCSNTYMSSIEVSECWNHIPNVNTTNNFITYIKLILEIITDPSLLYIKIGTLKHFITSQDINNKSTNLIEFVDKYILYNSSLSGYIINNNDNLTNQNIEILSQTKYIRDVAPTTSYLSDIRRKPKLKNHSRSFQSLTFDYCIYIHELMIGNDTSLPTQSTNCKSILHEIKSLGHKHWDVIGISIDISFSDLFPRPINILRALDLEFLRPRFIIVKLVDIDMNRLTQDSEETNRILQRNGFISQVDIIFSCIINNIKCSCRHIWGIRANIFDLPNYK